MAPVNRRGPTADSKSSAGRPDPNPVDIARRAYELFLERGGTHGYDVEDWLAAEHELAAFASAPEPGAAQRADGPFRPAERTKTRRSPATRA